MSAAGKNKNYLHHAIQTIRNVMDYAEENVWITHNPARSRFFQKPKSPAQEVHAIEQSQLGSKVIDELQKEENLKLLVAVAVAGIAGARRQELWVLTWDDIVQTQIRIDEAWKRYEPAEKRIGKPKTGRTRYVPIGPGTTALNYMATPAVELRNRVTEIDEALLGDPKKSKSKKKSASKSRRRTSA